MIERKFTSYYPVFYRLVFAIILAVIVIEGMGYIVGIPGAGGWHWLVMFLCQLLLLCLNYGKLGVRIISAIVLSLGIVLIIPMVVEAETINFFCDYIGWLFQAGEYEDQWRLGFQLIQTIWVTIGCYLYQILTEYKAWIKSITASFLAVALLVCMFFKYDIDHLGVVVIIGYILICYVENIRQGWEKKKGRDLREYTIFLVPFFLVFMLMAYCLPTNPEPYQWTTVRTIYGRISETLTIWWEDITRNGKEDFGMGVAGFSEDGGAFGGFIREENKVLMTIQGDVSLRTNLYLRGRTYDTFDGREWGKTVDENTMEYPLDTLETLYAVLRYDELYQTNYLHRENATVEYNYFDTGVLFTPLKSLYVSYTDYHIEGRDFAFEEQVGYGTKYDLGYYQMNQGTTEFMEMVETKLPEDEEQWNSIARRFQIQMQKLYTFDELIQYRKHMKETYLKEVKLTEELEEYVEEITQHCETPLQKMKAIEKELSRFVYTNMPGNLPREINTQEEYLEYFLLESREGYCAYFATAFVLLARAEGLPARYVEGFCVPITESKVMEVYSSRTHAWPEVYFEGVGWIYFEPTPGYGDVLYDSWAVKKPQNSEETVSNPTPTPSPTPVTEPAIPEETEQDSKDKVAGRLRIIGKCVLTVIFVCILILLIERIVRKRQYKRMNREEKFLVEAKRNLWIFAHLGHKRGISETLSELQEKIREDYPILFEEKQELVFLRGYQEYLYRRNQISPEILDETKKEREKLLYIIKKEHIWIYYTLLIRMLFSPLW